MPLRRQGTSGKPATTSSTTHNSKPPPPAPKTTKPTPPASKPKPQASAATATTKGASPKAQPPPPRGGGGGASQRVPVAWPTMTWTSALGIREPAHKERRGDIPYERRRGLSDARAAKVAAACARSPAAAPNALSMAVHMSRLAEAEARRPAWGPMRGPYYQNCWAVPYGLLDGRGAGAGGTRALPLVPEGEKVCAEAVEVMKGFSMHRPPFDSDDWYPFFKEPECCRPDTSGLPPLTESQMKYVENRIKWTRKRSCIDWAQGLLSKGYHTVLLSKACTVSWSMWYTGQYLSNMRETPAAKLIYRSGRAIANCLMAFLCGAHPRSGKNSFLRPLGPHLLHYIVSLLPLCWVSGDTWDGLNREPPENSFQKALECNESLPSSREELSITAFGNFSATEMHSDDCFSALISAYALMYQYGPWIDLESFIRSVEAGNIGNLKCYAFFSSGAYAHTPQERFMAIRLCETLFGVTSEEEESEFRKCFTGDGLVRMANGTTKRVCDISVGDYVKTESGVKVICKIERKEVCASIPMCELSGVWLTPGHPVFIEGAWIHPFELVPVVSKYVTHLYNFELSGGPFAQDHSLWINELLVCTLGKDCGERIVTGWPKANERAGTGYWRSGHSQWLRSMHLMLSPSIPNQLGTPRVPKIAAF
ncbi:hypothetical protein Pelo_3772 [Pelomyxa schiedti]|nr:hypothetical protein Pelo_3772 [Pelomyxa schiedti]